MYYSFICFQPFYIAKNRNIQVHVRRWNAHRVYKPRAARACSNRGINANRIFTLDTFARARVPDDASRYYRRRNPDGRRRGGKKPKTKTGPRFIATFVAARSTTNLSAAASSAYNDDSVLLFYRFERKRNRQRIRIASRHCNG